MPKNVRRFEFLMYAALAVFLAWLAWLFWVFRVNPFPQFLPEIGVLLMWWSFEIFLIWQAAHRRRNWARWILFVLFILETAVLTFNTVQAYQADTKIQYVLLLVRALEGLAYFFAFTGDARAWFRKDSIDIESVFE